MQHQCLYLPVSGIVVAVGVPVDQAVGIGNVFAVPVFVDDPQGGNAVIGTHIVIRVCQTEVCGQVGSNRLVRITAGIAGIDGHIGLAVKRGNGIYFRLARIAGIAYLDNNVIDGLWIIVQLVIQPGMIGLVVIKVKRVAEIVLFAEFGCVVVFFVHGIAHQMVALRRIPVYFHSARVCFFAVEQLPGSSRPLHASSRHIRRKAGRAVSLLPPVPG